MAKLGTLKYRKVQNNNAQSIAYGKWYPQAVQDRQLDFDQFIEHVADHNSPYSRGTIQGVATDLLDCLKELILDGKSVRFGDLGLFSIGMSSTGSEKREDCSAQNVKGVHLIVRNTKTWSNAELRKLCKIEELDAGGTTRTSTTSGSSSSGSGGSDAPVIERP